MQFDDEEDTRQRFSHDLRHVKKLSLPPDMHLSNKNEAKMLRKIKADTGLTEKEIRSKYKYRKMLSEASKKEGSKSEIDRILIGMLKSITQELKLPKKHPKVIERFIAKFEESKTDSWKLGYRYLQHLSRNDIMQKLGLK